MGRGIAEKKIFFIINPEAGGGKARLWWDNARAGLDELKLDYFWEYTRASGTAGAQARAAVLERGAQAVIAVGGDGTLYEVINGIIAEDRLIKEGLVLGSSTAGSACDFARLVYAGQSDDLPALIQRGREERIDIGKACYCLPNGEKSCSYFINSCDAGAGADTCLAVNAEGGRIKRRLKNGRMAFMLLSLKTLMTLKYTDTIVETDRDIISGQYIIIGVGNGQYIGGGMRMFPQASLSDGKLDLLLVKKRSRLQILRIFSGVYDGSFLRAPEMIYLQTPEITIKTARPIAVELDGEVPGYTSAFVSVLPDAAILLRPNA